MKLTIWYFNAKKVVNVTSGSLNSQMKNWGLLYGIDATSMYGLWSPQKNKFVSTIEQIGQLGPDPSVQLKLLPEFDVDPMMEQLKSENPELQKRGLYAARKLLQDQILLQEFVVRGGVSVIMNLMKSTAGNALSYALSIMEMMLSNGMGKESVDPQFISTLVGFLDIANVNTCKISLQVLLLLQGSSTLFSSMILSVLNGADEEATNTGQVSSDYTEGPENFRKLINCLGSKDYDVQKHAITLCNKLLHSENQGRRKELLDLLAVLKINRPLKMMCKQADQIIHRQLWTYQQAMFHEMNRTRQIIYTRDDPEHEELLMRLWRAVFPTQQLANRVSEQWKLLGFQGNDPATDFRGMGVIGLIHLLYFVENYTEQFRNIIRTQVEKGVGDYYPPSTAGIHISSLLFEVFGLTTIGKGGTNAGVSSSHSTSSSSSSSSSPDFHVWEIMFDHQNAFEELYCITFMVLDSTWKDLNATYMDFPKVIATVRQVIVAAASSCTTLNSFYKHCSMGREWNWAPFYYTAATDDEPIMGSVTVHMADDEESSVVKFLRSQIVGGIASLMQTKLLMPLRAGLVCRVATGADRPAWVGIQMSATMEEVLWAQVDKPSASLTDVGLLSRSVPISAIKDVQVSAGSKDTLLSFIFSSPQALPACVGVAPHNVAVSVADGLRLAAGLDPLDSTNLECLKKLIKAELLVKTISLDSVTIPTETPSVPEPPVDFNFHYDLVFDTPQAGSHAAWVPAGAADA